jgi:hypothetical protein
MSSQKLVKKGSTIKDNEGKLLLINEENKAYKVDDTVITLWHKCEGKSIDELIIDMSNSTGIQTSELKGPVEDLVSKLKEAKLVA